MPNYTLAERSEIVELYIQNQKSIVLTQRAYRRKYPRQKAPEPATIRAIYSKFTSTGDLNNVKRTTISRRARSDANINAVREHVAKYPNLSIHRRATALGIGTTSLQRILKDDLKLVPHKVNISEMLLNHTVSLPTYSIHTNNIYMSVDIITFRELVLYNDRTLCYHDKRQSIMY